jgi:hypothetical protein
MLEVTIRHLRVRCGLTILLAAAALSSCATDEPKHTALLGDPDAQRESSIPWNKPQGWESSAGLPAGLNGTNGSPNPNNPAGY